MGGPQFLFYPVKDDARAKASLARPSALPSRERKRAVTHFCLTSRAPTLRSQHSQNNNPFPAHRLAITGLRLSLALVVTLKAEENYVPNSTRTAAGLCRRCSCPTTRRISPHQTNPIRGGAVLPVCVLGFPRNTKRTQSRFPMLDNPPAIRPPHTRAKRTQSTHNQNKRNQFLRSPNEPNPSRLPLPASHTHRGFRTMRRPPTQPSLIFPLDRQSQFAI